MFQSVIGRAPAAPLEETAPPALTVGLALGGGAARGWAHIGVIERLLEAGIGIDVIAGCSVGAVVGGAYAAGRLAPMKEFALSLTKRRVFGLMDFSLGGSGLINGNRLTTLLQKELGDLRIEDLPLGFACVATEVRTGHEIWLSRGPVVQAMRASYALPGIFAPTRIHGRWLMDGALVNPVPVTLCRALGARLVIAVNLSADVLSRGAVVPDQIVGDDMEDLQDAEDATEGSGLRRLVRRRLVPIPGPAPGLYSVMIDAFNIIQDRITRSRLAGDPPDVAINPRLAPVGLFEFHRAAEAVTLGREATDRALPHILDAVAALS